MKTTLIAAAAFSALAALAEPNDWENTAVNSRNREPARAYSMPLASADAALTDALEPATPYRISLNGTWKISWCGNPALRPLDFWKTDFDDSDWFTIDVPSCVEMRGFGSPGYVNVRYPHANKWPRILNRDTEKPDYNPVTSGRASSTATRRSPTTTPFPPTAVRSPCPGTGPDATCSSASTASTAPTTCG